MLAILHHITDIEEPAGIMAILRDAMPPGSYLAISSFRMPGPELAESRARTIEMERLFNEQLGTGRWRSDGGILAWFGDWELIAPGLVPLWDWRADNETHLPEDAIYQSFVGGVARKA